jgi:hypothetical protein
VAENEVIGIGIEAKLEAFRQDMATIPGIGGKEAKALAAQLSQEIKAAEKASKAAEKAAKDSKKATADAAKGAGDLAEKIGKADTAAKKFGGALSGLLPEVGALVEGVGAVADVSEGLGAAAEAAGVGLGTVAAAAGGLVVVVGALAAVYRVQAREAEQVLGMRRLEAEVAASLVGVERQLVDAKAAEAVATGALTEETGRELATREAARRAVLDYAAAQAQQRQELRDGIATAERNLGILRSTIKAGLILATLPALPVLIADAAIEGVDKARARLDSFVDTIAGGIDSVIGWGDGIEDSSARLRVLDGAVARQAALQSELKDVQIRTTKATDGSAAATAAAAKAETERAEAVATLRDQLTRYADALSGVRGIEEAATADQATELDALTAARDAALEQLQEKEKAALDARIGDAAALAELDAATAEARLAVEARYQRDVAALREREADEAGRRREAEAKAEEAAAAARRSIQERLLGYARDGLAQVVGGLDAAATAAAERAGALAGRVVALDGYITESQRAELKKRIEASTAAARRAFEVAKIGKIAEATMNTFTGATAALASAPPPFNFVAAGLVTSAGLANVAQIAAQQPAFHSGGPVDLQPDEGVRRVRNREYVANPTGRAVLGDRTLERANAGIAPSSGAVVVQVYRHTRQVDRYEADRLSAGNPIAQALLNKKKPGMG